MIEFFIWSPKYKTAIFKSAFDIKSTYAVEKTIQGFSLVGLVVVVKWSYESDSCNLQTFLIEPATLKCVWGQHTQKKNGGIK